jgi:hypothetical protein
MLLLFQYAYDILLEIQESSHRFTGAAPVKGLAAREGTKSWHGKKSHWLIRGVWTPPSF